MIKLQNINIRLHWRTFDHFYYNEAVRIRRTVIMSERTSVERPGTNVERPRLLSEAMVGSIEAGNYKLTARVIGDHVDDKNELLERSILTTLQ